jgi:hypothetical protein
MENLAQDLAERRLRVLDCKMLHAAAIFEHKLPNHVLSYGKNYFCGKFETVHAEVDAISNLPSRCRNKKIDLLVIRTSKTHVLGNSQPCIECMNHLSLTLRRKGYILKDLYFSTATGTICKMKFKDIHTLTPHYSLYQLRFYKKPLPELV